MRVAAVQHDIVWEDGEQTRKHLTPLVEQAAGSGAAMIVLTEMYATGFSMRPDRIAEERGGPNEQFLVDQARRTGSWLIASIAQWDVADGRARNVAVLAGPDGERHRYAKLHPFTYAGEHERYAPGEELLTVELAAAGETLRVTPFVCYDLRFADEFWACAAGTDVYVVPANWPQPRREHWRALLRARAIENQAYVVGVNRVGTVRDQVYVGDSAIVDPLGVVLAEASGGESTLLAEVSGDRVAAVRAEFPFLRDRRG